MKRKFLASAAVAALTLASAFEAAAAEQERPTDEAQSAPSSPTAEPDADTQAAVGEVITITGIRASLQSAQSRKRNADTIVDSIVADDIGKLPDTNTTEALQRISGIQVSRDRGEGGSVAIRGLTQVLTTLNGREIFTAGGGRNYNLQNFPAELLAGIDVYKSPTADLIEGGIGGVIDLRTRRPLDLEAQTISGSAKLRYNDLIEKVSPLVSLLASDKWAAGDGEMGLLISGAYQERDFRSDVVTPGAPGIRTDIIPGQEIVTPNGDYEPLIDGNRRRIGLDALFQWMPNPDLEFYAQASYQEFRSDQQQRGFNNPTNAFDVVPGSVELFEGTNDFKSGTFQDFTGSTFGVARDTVDKNQQYSFGANWTDDRITLSGDFTYQYSTNDLVYAEQDLRFSAPEAFLDLSQHTPYMNFNGVDLTDFDSYELGYTILNENHYEGDSYAGRLDGEIEFDSPVISGLQTGVRYQKRTTDFDPIRFFYNPPAGVSAGPYADLFQRMPFDDYFPGEAGFERDYFVADPSRLRDDFDSVRDILGVSAEPALDPAAQYSMSEETIASYGALLFDVQGGLPFDGNIGLRVVKTKLSIDGNQRITDANGVTTIVPANYDNEYTNALPSANIRFHIADDMQLRFSASKTITRPSFSDLSPAFTLIPGQGQGSGGNPDLEPLKADQLDASYEYYFSPTGSIYLAGFYRKVKGFIFRRSSRQTIDGIDYVLQQPVNGEDGDIKGIEVGGQTFFDFLPAPFDGFGVQANYTYIDSETPSAIEGITTPLPNLSKNSFNISGLYENAGLAIRVAYNYRSKFLGSLYGLPLTDGGSQIIPVYRKGYGWLDASINYDLNENVTLTLEGSNLLRTREFTYFENITRPNNISIDDRQIMAGVRFNF
ncbi:TonB-dependent receptor [Pacificimonas flava]|uniref:TonB-dependent receptor n=1 Tax=Pacificimonas flava TaxID=1234595 RepID=M2TD04_9SPHN|nr:TonB-dependent receptor [Pacificimonas flava]EMD84389.1 TonB-dependent receptor [Pacificimonas flava]MBB5279738.1 TonB-dependent receptor [Pacificimonas flava]